MTATQLKQIRVRLTQMVQRLGTESSRLREEALGEVSADEPPPQPGEIGKPTAEQEIDIALLGNEAQLLADCNDALERIRRGTFGVCEQCGQQIAVSRLEAVPHARTCLACARQRERTLQS
jgi:RNA polymerase-binding transcription factor